MKKRWATWLITTFADGTTHEQLVKEYRFKRLARSSIGWWNWNQGLLTIAYLNSMPGKLDDDNILGFTAEVREL